MGRAIVLVSGGIDSATCLALACEEFDEVTPVHFDYGQQTNDLERKQAEKLVSYFYGKTNASIDELRVVDYKGVFQHFSSGVAGDRESFLTNEGDLIEKDGRSTGYVPMRNLHFITTGAAFADVEGADAVFHGAQGGDEEAYPDCREPFMISAQAAVAYSLADDDDVDINTPLLDKDKDEVIRLGEELEVPWEYTYSCYEEVQDMENPDPCGQCPACEERIEAFNSAGVEDPFEV